MGKLCVETLIMNCPENPMRLKDERKVAPAVDKVDTSALKLGQSLTYDQASSNERADHSDFVMVEKEDARPELEAGRAPETKTTGKVDPAVSTQAVEVQGLKQNL